MCAAFFRGTELTQNVKFKDKEEMLIKQWKWPPSFEKKVNLKAVNLDCIKKWMETRITEIMGEEDDILINFAISQIDEAVADQNIKLCPKKMQISLTGFLQKDSAKFMEELWDLLLKAQESPKGIPDQLVEKEMQKDAQEKQINNETKRKLERIKQLGEIIKKKERSDSSENSYRINWDSKRAKINEQERIKEKRRERSRSDERRHHQSHRRRDRSDQKKRNYKTEADDNSDDYNKKKYDNHREHHHKYSRQNRDRSKDRYYK